MPGDDADTFGVSLQDHDGVGDGAGQYVIWDLPHLEKREVKETHSRNSDVTQEVVSVLVLFL